MGISEDRWTCPECQRTIVVGLHVAARAGLRAAQERHASDHAGERPAGRVRPTGGAARLAMPSGRAAPVRLARA